MTLQPPCIKPHIAENAQQPTSSVWGAKTVGIHLDPAEYQ